GVGSAALGAASCPPLRARSRLVKGRLIATLTPFLAGARVLSGLGFKSRARNHLSANRPLEFRFEIVICRQPCGRRLSAPLAAGHTRPSTDRARPVYPIGDLRGLVPISYAPLLTGATTRNMAIWEATIFAQRFWNNTFTVHFLRLADRQTRFAQGHLD